MCMTANDGNDVNQNVMETNNNLSAEQSLKIISETMARNCRAIEKNQGTYYILWGVILAVVSALIYLLWNGESGLELPLVSHSGDRSSGGHIHFKEGE